MAPPPLNLRTVLSLSPLLPPGTPVTFQTARLTSPHHLQVFAPSSSNAPQLLLLDLRVPNKPSRRPLSSEAALLHPKGRLLAVRAGVNIKVLDVRSKTVVAAAVADEPIVFWKWVVGAHGADLLAVVTASGLFHWRVSAGKASGDTVDGLEGIFALSERFIGAQVVDYKLGFDGRWCVLVGIAQGEGGVVQGRMQLFSTEKCISQSLEGHAAEFAQVDGVELFCFVGRGAAGDGGDEASTSKFRVIEIGGVASGGFGKKGTDLFWPEDCTADFPVALWTGGRRWPGIAYMVTRMGYVHVFEVESASCMYTNRVSNTSVFSVAGDGETGAILCLNRAGEVLNVTVAEERVVDYVGTKLGDEAMAVRLAGRCGFRGADATFVERFEDAMEDGDYRGAADVAVSSPEGFLRTRETVLRFQEVEDDVDGVPPALVYFQRVLESGKLNEVESQLLALQLIQSQKVPLLEKWIREDKLFCSETLGDFVREASPVIALAVYIRAAAHEKVMQCMCATGQTNKVALYATKVGMKVSHRELVDMAAKFNPSAALDIANNRENALVLAEAGRAKGKPPIKQVESMVDMFLSKGMLNEATAYAMDNVDDEDEASSSVQTRILKACLVNGPQVADGILSQDIWHQYESFAIAMLCERIGLFQHALENYRDLSDVKRVIANTHVINPEFIVNYFSTIRPEDQLEVLEELLRTNPRGNIKLCVTVAAQYTESMGGPLEVIPVFESVPKVPDALFYYLAAIVQTSDVPNVHNRFIEVAVQLGQFGDAHTVTRDSTHYDPERIKNFLKDARPKDPRPLINVCDRFGFIDELVKYLVRNRQMKFVEGYVQRVNPLRCPEVVGALLDLDAMKEKDIKKLVASVKNNVPVNELVLVLEKRSKLKLGLEFLESLIADGATDSSVHTGVAKVYVDGNRNAQHFLETNTYYDSKAVGKYCAKRDPFLAYIAFRRGMCDEELLEVTNDNSLFKEQALYAVDRADGELWSKIFEKKNPFRRLVVDQVIATALPQCKRPDKVSAAVKAFLDAGMPDVLMEMLEKLVMQTSNTAFSRNMQLQNLLILTAIGAAPDRVMEYLRRMDNYDGPELAPSCVGAGLYEEAYAMYYKFDAFDDALDVLIDHIKDFNRAEEFAIRLDRADVWLKLGVAQLEHGIIGDGIRSLMRAKDASRYALVCDCARNKAETHDDFKMVAKFCRVARKKIREPEAACRAIDTELVHALCRIDNLTEVEEFIIMGGHYADLEDVGDRCFDVELYTAAKMMFRAIEHWPKLAHAHVMLKEFKEAVHVAKKAKHIPTWRIVCFACVDAEEFKLASTCALRLLVEVDEMQECIEYYEERGHFQDIMDVLEMALNSDRAHIAMFTEMAILLTKYCERRVLDFCRMWHGRFNVPKVNLACERAYLWDSQVFLFMQYNEWDNAANAMMDHSPSAFTPDEFLDVISRVGALNVMHRSIDFYLGEEPERLEDLLNVLAPRVDSGRTVGMLQRARTADFGDLGCLPFALNYMLKVQQTADVPEVNEAINSVLFASGDVSRLRKSIDDHRNFDQLKLASRLEAHDQLPMRRLATRLLARCGKHEKAIALAQRDMLYDDMIDAIAVSGDEELAETYSAWFVKEGLPEAFTALLYACYEFFPPDIAMEYAWNGEMRDFAMPFLIQTVAEAGRRLSGLEEERKVVRENEATAVKEAEDEVNEDVSVLLHGLAPAHQTPMLAYYQNGDGGGGFGGGAPLAIGWGGGGVGNLGFGMGSAMGMGSGVGMVGGMGMDMGGPGSMGMGMSAGQLTLTAPPMSIAGQPMPQMSSAGRQAPQVSTAGGGGGTAAYMTNAAMGAAMGAYSTFFPGGS